MHVASTLNAGGDPARKRKRVTPSSGDEVEANPLPNLPSKALGHLKSHQPLRIHQPPKTPQ